MALIQWQTRAKKHVRSVFEYYKKHASPTVAAAISNTIVSSVDILEEFPEIGKKDTKLSNEETTYRYVIAKYSKRTYRVYYLYENDTCSILAVWHCSMNPTKLPLHVIPKRRKAKR